MEEKEIKKNLLKENKEFKKTFEQHQKYEKELGKFKEKNYPTETEILKEKELKKKKLILKDKLFFMIKEYSRILKP